MAKRSLAVALLEEEKESAQFVMDHIHECNDRRWIKKAKEILEKVE